MALAKIVFGFGAISKMKKSIWLKPEHLKIFTHWLKPVAIEMTFKK